MAKAIRFFPFSMSKIYVFTVTCKVPIEARSREEANEIFAEEYLENLNEHMASKEVTEISEQDGSQSMSDRYFAIIQKDDSGQALGIAKSESGAWLDADAWGLTAAQALDCKCAETDEETFEAIKRGNSDAPMVLVGRIR